MVHICDNVYRCHNIQDGLDDNIHHLIQEHNESIHCKTLLISHLYLLPFFELFHLQEITKSSCFLGAFSLIRSDSKPLSIESVWKKCITIGEFPKFLSYQRSPLKFENKAALALNIIMYSRKVFFSPVHN